MAQFSAAPPSCTTPKDPTMYDCVYVEKIHFLKSQKPIENLRFQVGKKCSTPKMNPNKFKLLFSLEIRQGQKSAMLSELKNYSFSKYAIVP